MNARSFDSGSIFKKGQRVITDVRPLFPHCVWFLPNLTRLNIAGLGLSGSVPTAYESSLIGPNLSFVNLQHNFFTGTLSEQFMSQKFSTFDASFNRIVGTLPQIATENYNGKDKKILFSYNRISGTFPLVNWSQFAIVDVLRGNVFDCNQKHLYPVDDPAYEYYLCGSDLLDQSLWIWGVLTLLVILTIVALIAATTYETKYLKELYLLRWAHAFALDMLQWSHVTCDDRVETLMPNTFLLLRALHALCGVTITFFLIWLLLLVCLYTGLKVSIDGSSAFETHWYQYSYLVSGIFMSTPPPALIISSVFFLVMCTMTHTLIFCFRPEPIALNRASNRVDSVHPNRASVAQSNSSTNSESLIMKSYVFCNQVLRFLWLIFLGLMVFFPCLAVNIAYVVNSDNSDSSIATFLFCLIALFNIVYASFVIPVLMRYLSQFLGLEATVRMVREKIEYYHQHNTHITFALDYASTNDHIPTNCR